VALPDFTRWGSVERQPMRAVRRKTAEHLSAAWATIPHVTQCDLARHHRASEELRKKYTKQVESAVASHGDVDCGVKVIAAALRKFPQFNASIDMAADEIVVKKYVNIGVRRGHRSRPAGAGDSRRGSEDIVQLSVELAQLSEKAAQP